MQKRLCPRKVRRFGAEKRRRAASSTWWGRCATRLCGFCHSSEKIWRGLRWVQGFHGGECFRRLLCFRFEIEYTSLPLGSKKLQVFAREACERELASPEENGGLTAADFAEALQRASEAHVWLRQLLTRE